MDLDRYKSDDLKRDQRQLEALKKNLVDLLRIKYTAIVTLLGLALHYTNPIIALFPFLISFVIFFIEISYRKRICRNAAYLIVFYGQEIAQEWESRFHEYRKNSIKITRAKEFLKNFPKIKFLKFRWLSKIDKRIRKSFFFFLGEENFVQNFYILELWFIYTLFGYIFFTKLMTLSFSIFDVMLIFIVSMAFIFKVCFFYSQSV